MEEKNRSIAIPQLFLIPPFDYMNNKEILHFQNEEPFSDVLNQQPYFYYDILAALDIESFEPWKNEEYTIPIIFQKWEEKKAFIAELFKQRSNRKIVREPMTKSVSWFISALFWTNETSVPGLLNLKEEIRKLPIKPINLEERLEFILLKIDQFHSFIQVGELFEELKKQYYKQQMINKRKK